MLNIYTENFYLVGKFKHLIKRFLGKESRGPQAVLDSLILGLKALKQPYELNQNHSFVFAALVLNGYKTLAWAIRQKKAGKIKYLFAGPNVVLTPFDHKSLILDKAIDAYLVPSLWTKNWWGNLVPRFSQKIFVWPSGVSDFGSLAKPEGHALIFFKSGPLRLLQEIEAILYSSGTSFRKITYGNYSPNQYKDLLTQTKFLIYISESESQGLALHEAWMANIPTLVWCRGFAEIGEYKWQDTKISAPYLTDECGLFFKDSDEFKQRLEFMLRNYSSFHAREYSLKNFTNEISARNLLNIIKIEQ